MEDLNFTSSPVRQKILDKAVRDGIPVAGVFELTPSCNFACKMCYVHDLNEDHKDKIKTPKEWIEYMDTCIDNGMIFALLTGGEPLLYPGFKEIYKHLYDRGVLVSINTNASLITEELATWLKERLPVQVNATIYGASNETYERLCQVKNGYDKAIKGIKLLKDIGVDVHINATINRYNVEDIEKIFDIGRKLNLPIKPATYNYPRLRIDDDNFDCFSDEEGSKAMLDVSRAKRKGMFYRAYLEGLKDCKAFPEMQECMAGTGAFWITWDGYMVPCGMLDYPKINAFEGNFRDNWDKLHRGVLDMKLPDDCTSCKLRKECGVCRAICYLEGDKDTSKLPAHRCAMTKGYYELSMKDLEEIRGDVK